MEVVVRGFRGRVRDPKAVPWTIVRADRVYGADHLRLAAMLAQRAFDEGRGRASDLATETLLYAAGERQIGKALAFVGIAPDTDAFAVVGWGDVDAYGAREGWIRDDQVLAGGAHVLDAFGVTTAERAMFPQERWGDLILERVALVDVLKA